MTSAMASANWERADQETQRVSPPEWKHCGQTASPHDREASACPGGGEAPANGGAGAGRWHRANGPMRHRFNMTSAMASAMGNGDAHGQ